jgi:hypothetical protein
VLLSFFQSDILRNYDLIYNSLKFRTLYSRRPHLNPIFVINDFKRKIMSFHLLHCRYSCACKTVGELSAFSVSSPSAKCRCRFLDIFRKIMFPLRTLSQHENCLDSFYILNLSISSSSSSSNISNNGGTVVVAEAVFMWIGIIRPIIIIIIIIIVNILKVCDYA